MHWADTSKTSTKERNRQKSHPPPPVGRHLCVFFAAAWTTAIEAIVLLLYAPTPQTVPITTGIDSTIDTLSAITACLGTWKKILQCLFLWTRTIAFTIATLAVRVAMARLVKERRMALEWVFQNTMTTVINRNYPTTPIRFQWAPSHHLWERRRWITTKK